MRITYRKIGGLHFIRIGRYQLSVCRLRAAPATRYTQAANDEWFPSADIEPRHHNRQQGFITRVQHSIHNLISNLAHWSSLDPDPLDPIDIRVTRFLSSPAMREAREIESLILGVVALPVVLIWSVMLIEFADRMKWF